jgi:hypothetical protein
LIVISRRFAAARGQHLWPEVYSTEQDNFEHKRIAFAGRKPPRYPISSDFPHCDPTPLGNTKITMAHLPPKARC